MDEAAAMKRLERAADLGDELADRARPLRRRERRQPGWRGPVAKLAGEERAAVGAVEIEDAHQVRMLDRRQHGELPAQPLARILVATEEIRVQDLERDLASVTQIGGGEEGRVGARAEWAVEPPATAERLGRCQLRLHPLKLRAHSPFVKAGSGGIARTRRRSSVMSSMA